MKKAVAVCPDGNDLLFDPSGRGIRQVYFRELTAPAISATEKASDTNIRPHELRPRTPPIFSPSINAAGAYCR